MSIHAAIYSHLLHDSDVALLVEGRVFPTVAERNAKPPYIVFQRITARRTRHFTAPSGLVDSGLQIDCYSTDSNEVEAVAEAVRCSLDGLHKTDIGRAPDDAAVQAAFLENSRDDYEDPTDASERGLYRVIQDWTIWHTETLPELAV